MSAPFAAWNRRRRRRRRHGAAWERTAGRKPAGPVPRRGRARREVPGQHAPRAAAAQHVQDGLDHPAQLRAPPPPEPAWRRHVGADPFPLRIGQVTCMAQPLALMLSASDSSPHVAAPRLFAHTPRESQLAEITQLIPGRTLRGGREAPHGYAPPSGRQAGLTEARTLYKHAGPARGGYDSPATD